MSSLQQYLYVGSQLASGDKDYTVTSPAFIQAIDDFLHQQSKQTTKINDS